jgi:hypothetical protein
LARKDRDYTRDRALPGTWDNQVQKDARNSMEVALSNTLGGWATLEPVP